MVAADHRQAARLLIDWLELEAGVKNVAAIGQRIVHGGSRYTTPQRITPELIAELRRLSRSTRRICPRDRVDRGVRRQHAGVPQVACFDTAFHRDLPDVARCCPSRGAYRRGRPALRLSRSVLRVPAGASCAAWPAPRRREDA